VSAPDDDPRFGPVVALTYRATVDVPARFRNSKAVGAVFGLTPSNHQSGEIDRMGGISKCGDAMMRTVPPLRENLHARDSLETATAIQGVVVSQGGKYGTDSGLAGSRGFLACHSACNFWKPIDRPASLATLAQPTLN
jgi:Transposase IS116/IS110/IS902 family